MLYKCFEWQLILWLASLANESISVGSSCDWSANKELDATVVSCGVFLHHLMAFILVQAVCQCWLEVSLNHLLTIFFPQPTATIRLKLVAKVRERRASPRAPTPPAPPAQVRTGETMASHPTNPLTGGPWSPSQLSVPRLLPLRGQVDLRTL